MLSLQLYEWLTTNVLLAATEKILNNSMLIALHCIEGAQQCINQSFCQKAVHDKNFKVHKNVHTIIN
jgi:hypothetical protein